MMSLSDIGEVSDTMTQGPIADIAPLVADDKHGVLEGDDPMLSNPIRFTPLDKPCYLTGFRDIYRR